MTSAVVALLVQARPTLTPDQVKKILVSSGTPLAGLDSRMRMINANRALATATPTNGQAGTLVQRRRAARIRPGSNHVVHAGKTLIGEASVWGSFSSSTWAAQSAGRNVWVGGVWNGRRLAGDGWTGTSWASKTWAPATWSSVAFSGDSWVDPSWAGRF